MRTDEEILKQTNRLARLFYKGMGYNVPEDFLFYEDNLHPQEELCWYMATLAQLELTNTDVEDVLSNLGL